MSDEFDFKQALSRELRAARLSAKAFVAACEAGNVGAFFEAVDRLNETTDGWRFAMTRVGRLPAVSSEIRAAFLSVWIESKMLPLKVGNRRALANALRILLPGGYAASPIRVYRGAQWQERRCRRYGFSWTLSQEMARRFAKPHAGIFEPPDPRAAEMALQWGGGVVLETVAPPDAILLIRDVEEYYDESEVVIDPFKLRMVAVVERLRAERTSALRSV